MLNIDLEYPAHLLELKDNMADFIYEDGFWEDWKECGLNVEKDLWDLEASLTAFPEAGSVIQGTGGLRKLRSAIPGRGKRGGVRLIYMWIPEIFIFYMFTVYKKTVQDDLTDAAKKILRQQAEAIRSRLLAIYG